MFLHHCVHNNVFNCVKTKLLSNNNSLSKLKAELCNCLAKHFKLKNKTKNFLIDNTYCIQKHLKGVLKKQGNAIQC